MNRSINYVPFDDLAPVDDLNEANRGFRRRGLDPVSLPNNQIRWFNPTPGRWFSERQSAAKPTGQNLCPCVGR